MKRQMAVLAAALLMASPVLAQNRNEGGGEDAMALVVGIGGFARAVGDTTGDGGLEGGVRIAPHLMAFGSLGRFGNLQADLQPTIAATTASLADQGLVVFGSGRVPAWFGLGGVRGEFLVRGRVIPYGLVGVGGARLSPTTRFAFSGGTLPDGTEPMIGSDVTPALLAAGSITRTRASSAPMFTAGGGAQVLLASHWAADIGYRYARIAADSSLSASALNANGMALGVGYRF